MKYLLEKQLQTCILNYLQILENQGKLYYIRNQSGALINQQGRFIKFGRAGSADIMVFFKGGKTVFLEVKLPKKKQTQNQIDFQKQIEDLGFLYYIAHSIEEVEILIKNYKEKNKIEKLWE